MLLAIDVGNSNIKVGLHRDGAWEHHFRVQTNSEKTPDEYALLFKHLLLDEGVRREDINRAAISSVVPPLTGTLKEMLVENFGLKPLVLGPGVKTGMSIRTDNPAEVGSDLVANAAAAYHRIKGACVVVAFGTAITFTGVSAKGEMTGVAIAPGLNSAAESLFRKTAQLRLVDLTPPATVGGTNTIHSIQAGILHGYVGLVEHLTRRMIEEIGGSAEVICTGEQARILQPLTGLLDDFEPWLTLEGLRIIAEKNLS